MAVGFGFPSRNVAVGKPRECLHGHFFAPRSAPIPTSGSRNYTLGAPAVTPASA